jgi:hypothetical protein
MLHGYLSRNLSGATSFCVKHHTYEDLAAPVQYDWTYSVYANFTEIKLYQEVKACVQLRIRTLISITTLSLVQ